MRTSATKTGTAKQKPVYPAWSEKCEHAHGIPLNKAWEIWVGKCSLLSMIREQIKNAPSQLPESAQKQMRQAYLLAHRDKRTSFAERALNQQFFITGIRFPFADPPVREEIPFELWCNIKMFPEKNMVRTRGWHNELVTYVDVRVSDRFWHNADYSLVILRNLQFRFNTTQAMIVRLLHESLKQGNYDGLFAKSLLHQVGKKSGDIGDYFKDQELWRLLIAKTTPGRYVLNAYGFGPYTRISKSGLVF
jgi:hypothetical protein